jgi:3-oxoacyl-[acyl-carrier protein] reductase
MPSTPRRDGGSFPIHEVVPDTERKQMTDVPVVVVTGGSRGIGRAIMARLRSEGYAAVGVSRSTPSDAGPDEEFVECDLSDAVATAELGRRLACRDVYGLVNNAAVTPTADEDCALDAVTPAEMDREVRLGLYAPMLLSQALVPAMRRRGSGRIVNISSRAMLGKPKRTAYAAAKSGLMGMSRTWALELAGDAITVNVVAPGPVETEAFRTANPDADSAGGLIDAVPLKRAAHPDEVAHAVAFLIDERAGYITGQTVYIDGGLTVAVIKP